MRREELWKSRFVRASDLQGRSVEVTIERAVPEVLKGGSKGEQTKIVVYFVGRQKALVCNLVNFDSIVEATGADDSDQWAGHKIELYPTNTAMGGNVVPCIRVRTPKQASLRVPAPAELPEGLDTPF